MSGRALVVAWMILAGASSAGAQINVKIGDPLPRLDTFPAEKQREIEAAMARDFWATWGKYWPHPVYSARDIHLNIEARRATFQAGNPVEVRLTLTNQSDHEVRYFDVHPKYRTELRVYDAAGHAVALTLWQPSLLTTPCYGCPRILGPGETEILRDFEGNEWLDLKDWHYDLRGPGTYTIVGAPMVSGPTLTIDTTIRSNRAEITIVK